jgi:hypothetical protein
LSKGPSLLNPPGAGNVGKLDRLFEVAVVDLQHAAFVTQCLVFLWVGVLGILSLTLNSADGPDGSILVAEDEIPRPGVGEASHSGRG